MQARWRALLREFELGEVGSDGAIFPLPPETPNERIDGTIQTPTGKRRSHLAYTQIVNRGINCVIQKGLRKLPQGGPATQIAIKRPKYPHRHLLAEALVQALAHGILAEEGLRGAVPAVYDIYSFANEMRFAMEWIEGQSVYEFLSEFVRTPGVFEMNFLHVLLQLSAILECIHRRLQIDHRDLKLDNIWIRRQQVAYTFSSVRYTAPFQVVLLDFGFACIGDENRKTVLNLGRVIPDLDACPKEGRDLYHILNRLLDPPEFGAALSEEVRSTILGWMEPIGPSFHRRSLVLTAPPDFSMPALSARAVLAWTLGRLHPQN